MMTKHELAFVVENPATGYSRVVFSRYRAEYYAKKCGGFYSVKEIEYEVDDKPQNLTSMDLVLKVEETPLGNGFSISKDGKAISPYEIIDLIHDGEYDITIRPRNYGTERNKRRGK